MIFTSPQLLCASPHVPAQKAPGLPPAAIAKQTPQPRVTEGRIRINLPSQEMTIAQTNKIPLDLHGYAPDRILVGWKFSEPSIESETIAEPEETQLQHAPDGSTYVNFVPIRLGKLMLRIYVAFKDGGFDTNSVGVNVDRLPAQVPRRLILADPLVTINFQRKAGTLHIAMAPRTSKELLIPVAFYNGIDSPVPFYPIPASLLGDIQFSVIPRKDQAPPISFNPATGDLEPIQPGQALVKATVRGKSAYACVDVMKDLDEWSERSSCEDFLPPDLTEPIDKPMHTPKTN
jgi:hypothetical protein